MLLGPFREQGITRKILLGIREHGPSPPPPPPPLSWEALCYAWVLLREDLSSYYASFDKKGTDNYHILKTIGLTSNSSFVLSHIYYS